MASMLLPMARFLLFAVVAALAAPPSILAQPAPLPDAPRQAAPNPSAADVSALLADADRTYERRDDPAALVARGSPTRRSSRRTTTRCSGGSPGCTSGSRTTRRSRTRRRASSARPGGIMAIARRRRTPSAPRGGTSPPGGSATTRSGSASSPRCDRESRGSSRSGSPARSRSTPISRTAPSRRPGGGSGTSCPGPSTRRTARRSRSRRRSRRTRPTSGRTSTSRICTRRRTGPTRRGRSCSSPRPEHPGGTMRRKSEGGRKSRGGSSPRGRLPAAVCGGAKEDEMISEAELTTRAPAAPNLVALLDRQAKLHAANAALKHKRDGRWQDVSWGELARRARDVSDGLAAFGIRPGDRIAVIGDTNLEWMLADLGILGAGAATATIYQSNQPEECRYIVENAGARLVFCDSAAQVAKLREVKARLPTLEGIVRAQGPA